MKYKEYFTVVVADDETELREAVCQLIPWEELGFRLVGSAGNGLDALQCVEQHQPDFLITDIRMPFISGVSLAKQVRELQPLIQIAFLSGYDDFEYAKKAIDYNVISYLLKPIGMEELTEALREIHKKIEAKFEHFRAPSPQRESLRTFLPTLLLDSFAEERSDAGLLEELSRAGLAIKVPYSLAVLSSRFCRQGENCTVRDMIFTVDKVLGGHFTCNSFFSGGRIFSLLISENGFDGLSAALEELLSVARRVLGLEGEIGVSREHFSVSRCAGACREAVDAQRFAAESGIRRAADFKTGETVDDADALELSAELEGVLRGTGRIELEKHLNSIFPAGQSDETVKMTALRAASTVQRVLYAAEPPEKVTAVFRSCQLLEPLSGEMKAQELQRRVRDLCLAARELLSERQREGVSLLCNKATDIIERDYMDESISLSSVSEQLHVSPNYLSANMKKYAGDTFINLLIKKRMEVASQLLTSGNLKIFEVAKLCGYSDQHYFSFCFKKYYGVSPARLRRGDAEREGQA